MLDFSFGELALVALVAILVVGPKDMPVVMRHMGRWLGKFRGMTEEFRRGFRSVMMDSELHGGLGELRQDFKNIHEETKFIRADNGVMQPVYDISEFLNERDKAKLASHVALPDAEEVERKAEMQEIHG